MKVVIKEAKQPLSENKRAWASLNEELQRIQKINEEITAQVLAEEEDNKLVRYEKENEGNIKHFMLDLVGLVPGIGEFADLYNAILYIRKGEWLMAGFSLISMLPGLGDAIGKGGKIATLIARAGKDPKKVAAAIKSTQRLVKRFSPQIKTLLRKFEKNEKVGKYIPHMEKAIGAFAGERNRSVAAKGVAQATQVQEPNKEEASRIMDMAKNEKEDTKEVQEMMVQGVGPPSTSNAAETMPIGDSGALLKGWEELEQIQKSAQPEVMKAIYNNGISNVGDAIQLLEMIQKDLEDQLVRSDYVKNDPYYGKDLGSRSANDMQEEELPRVRRGQPHSFGPKEPIKLKIVTHRRKPLQKA